jgi:hypothetical protein
MAERRSPITLLCIYTFILKNPARQSIMASLIHIEYKRMWRDDLHEMRWPDETYRTICFS